MSRRDKDMSSRENLRKNTAEMRLYELLGIKLFRKVILLFERVKYILCGKKNENYHPHDMSCGALRRFSGYLIYNSVFHILSLILVAIYFFSARIISVENIVIDIVLGVVVVLDIYCLMLQRYIYLRLRQRIDKKRQMFLNAKEDRIADVSKRLKTKSSQDINEELAFLEEFKLKLLSGTDVVLADDSETILINICEVLNQKVKLKPKKSCPEDSFFGLSDELQKKTKVIGFKLNCVSKIQKILRFEKKDNVRYGVCIITGNPKIETIYKRIFPHPSLDSILETVEVLSDAYRRWQKEMVQ